MATKPNTTNTKATSIENAGNTAVYRVGIDFDSLIINNKLLPEFNRRYNKDYSRMFFNTKEEQVILAEFIDEELTRLFTPLGYVSDKVLIDKLVEKTLHNLEVSRRPSGPHISGISAELTLQKIFDGMTLTVDNSDKQTLFFRASAKSAKHGILEGSFTVESDHDGQIRVEVAITAPNPVPDFSEIFIHDVWVCVNTIKEAWQYLREQYGVEIGCTNPEKVGQQLIETEKQLIASAIAKSRWSDSTQVTKVTRFFKDSYYPAISKHLVAERFQIKHVDALLRKLQTAGAIKQSAAGADFFELVKEKVRCRLCNDDPITQTNWVYVWEKEKHVLGEHHYRADQFVKSEQNPEPISMDTIFTTKPASPVTYHTWAIKTIKKANKLSSGKQIPESITEIVVQCSGCSREKSFYTDNDIDCRHEDYDIFGSRKKYAVAEEEEGQ